MKSKNAPRIIKAKKLYRIHINNGCFLLFDEEEVIKETESIEELVDYYIGIRDGIHYFWNKADSKYAKSDKVYKLMIVYAAIWTDAGLIYVAKMNEKGELELL